MAGNEGIDILSFITSKPEVLWSVSLIGAVCVIGLVDYFKCFFESRKKATRWVVLFVSLAVSVILSPLVPGVITAIIIVWFLILSIATIAKKNIIDSIQLIIIKMTGCINKEGPEKK